jgi:Tol biopolymer transport system component
MTTTTGTRRPPAVIQGGAALALALIALAGIARPALADGAVPACGGDASPDHAVAPICAGGRTKLVSVSSKGVRGSNSVDPSLSADGRFVAFRSFANNLVPGDTNGDHDIFVRDRQAGRTERVSVSSKGVQGNAQSLYPSLSADGRFVAFYSDASNLVPGDTNGTVFGGDTFVRDRRTGRTQRVSIGPGGVQGDEASLFAVAISAGGRFVAFNSGASNLVRRDTNGFPDVFIRDLRAGRTELVSVSSNGVQGDGSSGGFRGVTLSAAGRFVAFSSDATNLVPGDTNGFPDVFVRDRRTSTTERVSVGPSGVQGNGESGSSRDGPIRSVLGLAVAISAGGRFVAFESDASNLVPRDTNGFRDVFVRDRRTGKTVRVSVGPDGVQGNGDSGSDGVAISPGGHFVAFSSNAANLVPGDTNRLKDVFVHDRRTGRSQRVSVRSRGRQGNGESGGPSLSAEGRFVAFYSGAPNLVPGDDRAEDVFVRTR